ncbi:TetR/AcrR family transcriptional regulator [Nocardioides plantarum]|uniref:TetR/AcrR family transcriptional regulator n=1 Tax=Nocardioides plantarum TaxID=29299 RepID=A0ABV5KF00_9ACTN|nr:TetR/AcrR family transcriptional regulator [Nocardioides plantarum]
MTTARYHHGNLREALADAAVESAREHGPDGLAVRELARRVGVSHNAAYRHFADRDALVDVVAERAMNGLVEVMERRIAGVTETHPVRRARARLTELGRGYVDYAVAEPGLFRVLFTAYPEFPEMGTGTEPGDPFAMLNAALDDLVAVGYLAPRTRAGAAITCWSAVHGFSVLCIEGPLRGLAQSDRDAALAAMLDTIDAAYGVSTT